MKQGVPKGFTTWNFGNRCTVHPDIHAERAEYQFHYPRPGHFISRRGLSFV